MQEETIKSRAVGALGRFGRSRHAPVITALGVVCFAFLVTTASRTITFSDAGDFLMGISTVGNIHGPGYPLYLMTAKLFGWLVPFGSPALKAALYSAIFASITTCLIYWIVFRMTSSRIAGALAGLSYCFSYTFWYQSVIPETYSLNAFFVSLLIVLALRWERQISHGRGRQADATMCVFALVFGLALTNHFSILFILPAFLFFAVDTDWRRALAPRNLLRMAAFACLGLLPYIYEPAAAFRGPAYNYGDPSTPLRWFRHISVYYQRSGLFKYPYSYFPARFFRYFGTLTTEFPYFWWLGGVGFLASFKKPSKKYPLFLLLLFLLSVLPVMTYKQFESVLRAHFYYESYLVFTLWIGFGAAAVIQLFSWLGDKADPLIKTIAIALVSILLLSCPLISVATHYKEVDKSDYEYARDMACGMLSTAGRDSVILANDDNVIFPCLYMQVVEKMRTDIRVVSVISTGTPGFRGTDLLARTPAGSSIGDSSEMFMYVPLVEGNYARIPVYTTITDYVRFTWGHRWLGLLVRLYPSNAALPVEEKEPEESVPDQLYLEEVHQINDCDARWSVLLPWALKAGVLYARKDYLTAESVYGQIITTFQNGIYVPTLYGCAAFAQLYELWGQVLNLQSKYIDTTKNLPLASVIDPDFFSLSLAKAYASLGEFSNAIAEFERYLAFEPADASARADLSEVYIRLQDYTSAERELSEAITLNENDARIYLLYGRVLLLQGCGSEAKTQLERAIELDPTGEIGKAAHYQLELIEK